MGIKNIQGELRVNNKEVVTTANIIELAEKATPELSYYLAGGREYICKGGSVTGDVRIASEIDGLPVDCIAQAAFEDNHEITQVIIPNSVTDIEPRVFNNCSNLINVVLSDKLTQLSWGLFSNCTSLITVNIPKSITHISISTFDGCESLTYIIIPSNVTSISYDAFKSCPNLTIYCEATEQPEGWDTNWNPDNRPVVWGFKNNFIDLNNAISTEANSDLIVRRNADGEILLPGQDMSIITDEMDISVSGKAVKEYIEGKRFVSTDENGVMFVDHISVEKAIDVGDVVTIDDNSITIQTEQDFSDTIAKNCYMVPNGDTVYRYIEDKVGNIDTALDAILAIQESLIGGNA